MIAPLAAGYIWVRFGYPWVFFLSAAVGLLMLLTSSRIPPKAALTTPPAPSTAASPL
jgi:MFS family permease